ncbi:hypothetical protein BP6252_02307 [Coleophoma cylindrospora]|uniref:WD40 repeat-like protein n=1 Tax=Coleophoma cylindrospora TaxID=1849047 RepID=A0A3D8SEE5_9HELO|nr:hypothetical protein BP6252_02307 [Coleophoma cylindrospora]
MQYSRTLKSSAQSLPSPDGAYIATVLPSALSIRSTRSLEILHTRALPADFSNSIAWFFWSDSSDRLLVASSDLIKVYSASDPQFKANIVNPTSGTVKITHVSFGSSDNEVNVLSEFGLKLTVFNLLTSKSVDINSPKFFNTNVAIRGLCYRPGTSNLTLLTRSGGKDILSIHARETLEVVRSWSLETVDAQGVSWSPDGRWLAVLESAGQGHKIFFYTADRYLYKVWNGPMPMTEEDRDIDLGAGVKFLEWSATGAHIAVGDYSKRVTILAIPSFSEIMSFQHVPSLRPKETLQIWLEQVSPQNGAMARGFVKASQVTCPPTASLTPTTNKDVKSGTIAMAFDASGTLLATRTEDFPTSVWIWDVTTKILRANLILHAPVAKMTWHPKINELLMLRCEGEETKGLTHLWDPSWESPRIIDFASQLPGGKLIGKSIASWLNVDAVYPVIFFSDSQDCLLTSISDGADDDLPWEETSAKAIDIYGDREESPLNLVEADEKRPFRRVTVNLADAEAEDSILDMCPSEESEEFDDTFQFKKAVDPTNQ